MAGTVSCTKSFCIRYFSNYTAIGQSTRYASM